MAGGRSNRRPVRRLTVAAAAALAAAATSASAQSVQELQAAGDIDKWDYLNGKLLNEKEAMQGKISDLQDHIADWKATELRLKLKLAALKNETTYDLFRLKASKPDLFTKKKLNHTFNATQIIIPTEQAGPAQTPVSGADAAGADAKRAKGKQAATEADDLTAELPPTKPVSVASAEKTPAVLLLDTRAKGSHSLGGAAAADAEACRAACLSGKVSDGTPLPGTCYATHFVGGACYFEGLAASSADADADAEASHGHACSSLTLAAEKGVVSWVLPGVYSKAAGACGKGKKATPLVNLDGSAPAVPEGVKSFVQTTEEAAADSSSSVQQPLAEAAAAPAPQPSLRRRLMAVVGLAEAPAPGPLAEATPTNNPLAKPPTVIETMLKTAAVVTAPDAQAAADEWAAEEAAEEEEEEEEDDGEWEEEDDEEADGEWADDEEDGEYEEEEDEPEGEWAEDEEADGEYEEEDEPEGEWVEGEEADGEYEEDEPEGEWVEGEEEDEDAADDQPVVAAPTSFIEESPAAAGEEEETEADWAADEDAAADAEYEEALEGGEAEEAAEEADAAADDDSTQAATIPLPAGAVKGTMPVLRRLSRRLLQSGMLPDPHGGPAHGLNNVANAGAELTINGTANSLAAAVEAIRTVALTTTHGVHALVDLPLDAGGAALGGMGDGVRAMGVGVRSRMYAVREGHADAPDTATRYESADTAKSVAGMRAANQVAAGGLVPPDAAAAAAAQARVGQSVTMPATGGTAVGATGAVATGSAGPAAAATQAAASDAQPAPAPAAPKAQPSPEAVAAAKAAGPQPRVLALGAASALPSTDASVYLGTVANVPSADACAEMCRAHTAGTDNTFGRAVRVSPFAGTSLGEVSGYMSVSSTTLAANCVAASYYSAAKSNAGGAATADDAARVGHVCDLWAGLPTGPAAASNAAVLGGQASLLEFHPEPEGSGDSVAMVLVDRWDALTAATP